MQIHWFEQAAGSVPADDGWLSESEAARLAGMRVPKRRSDWRLGRWTAKHAVASWLHLPFTSVQILPAPGGAPQAFIGSQTAPVSISLSHRAGVAACAVTEPGMALGCDLELIEPRSAAFAEDYFTPREQMLIAQAPASSRDEMLALLWSAKESVLKLLQEGLRLDTRRVSIDPESAQTSGWAPLQARYAAQAFRGWWQRSGPLVRTLVAARLS